MDKIALFWFSIDKFRKRPKFFSKKYIVKLMKPPVENYGDLMSKYLIEKLTGKKTKWYDPRSGKQQNLFAIGSILNYSNEKTVVWGSGIIQKDDAVGAVDFKAVRGPLTHKRLIELGKQCPEIYGDPAILLSRLFTPVTEKKYNIGFVPHFVDYKMAMDLFSHDPNIKIVNLLTKSVEKTTKDILSCSCVISSSLHGLIIAHAYNIPAIWVRLGNRLYGDNIKFRDYLLSVGIEPYDEIVIDKKMNTEKLLLLLDDLPKLPHSGTILKIQNDLLRSFPYPFSKKYNSSEFI